MNSDIEELPPSYTEIEKNFAYYVSKNQAAKYKVSSEQVEGGKYTALNQAMSNNNGIEIFPIVKFSNKPVQCTCPYCHSLVITRVERTPGILVWILCGILILFGFWLGCCLIPFCIDDIQNAQHYCSNCNAFIAEYRRL